MRRKPIDPMTVLTAKVTLADSVLAAVAESRLLRLKSGRPRGSRNGGTRARAKAAAKPPKPPRRPRTPKASTTTNPDN